MVTLKRTNQGGAVLSFIIVAVVLAVTVIGTAYFVKHRGELVRADQAVAVTPTYTAPTPAAPAPTTTPKKTVPTATPTPAATPTTPSSNQPSNNKTVPLPKTGPESGVIDLLAIGLLVASATAYASSRRSPSRTL